MAPILGLWLVMVGCAPTVAPEHAVAPAGPAQAAPPTPAPAASVPPTSTAVSAAPFPPAGVARPATPEAVRLGFIGTASDAGLVLAMERGYFTAVGIDVEMVPFSTAAEMVAP